MTEIETLREEIAKLRERVAVLESVRTIPAYVPPLRRPWESPRTGDPYAPPFYVTCGAPTAAQPLCPSPTERYSMTCGGPAPVMTQN